jgi:hypothetical protein
MLVGAGFAYPYRCMIELDPPENDWKRAFCIDRPGNWRKHALRVTMNINGLDHYHFQIDYIVF